MSKYGVFSGLNTGKYGPEKTPYLDTFHTVSWKQLMTDNTNIVVMTEMYFTDQNTIFEFNIFLIIDYVLR